MDNDSRLLAEAYDKVHPALQKDNGRISMRFDKLKANEIQGASDVDIPVISQTGSYKVIVHFRKDKIQGVSIKSPTRIKIDVASVNNYFYNRGFDLGHAIAAALYDPTADSEGDMESKMLGEI